MARAQAGEGGSNPRVTTLKKRAEFLRVRKGARWAVPAFVLEAKTRNAEGGGARGFLPRFGFTVTRQVGKAVERNRIRRRLKAAVANVAMQHAKGDFDYVLIARRPALTAVYAELVTDLAKALDRVHRPPAPGRRPREASTPVPDKSR